MTLTKKVVLVTTVTATAPIIENRFIGFDGAQAKANAPVFGVTPREADKGDSVSVECIGIVLVEAGGAITVGAKVASDAQGCAVAGENNAVGYAVSGSTEAGELVTVLLKG
nr:MAG TPA: capsid fiber protein [Caudoviricetes sp.]